MEGLILEAVVCVLSPDCSAPTAAPNCFESAADFVELEAEAGRHNRTAGITGFLLFTRPFFLQYIEGPPARCPKQKYGTIIPAEKHYQQQIPARQNQGGRKWTIFLSKGHPGVPW